MIKIVDLNFASKVMQTLGPVHVDMAIDTLQRMRALSGLIRAFDELRPEKIQSLFGTHLSIVVGDRGDVVGIGNRIIEALKELFPIEEDLMVDYGDANGNELFDDLGSVAIIPAYIGVHISWDDLDSFFSGEDTFRETMSLPMFCGAVFNQFDREHWEYCAGEFGWEVEWPENLLDGKQVDWKKFEELVSSSDIPISMSTFNIIFEDTGLAFFDENPFSEYGLQDRWSFSYEEIVQLARQWEKAELMMEAFDSELELVVEQPAILANVLELISQSLVPEKPRRRQSF